jgi:kinetochore protein Nuf2
LDELTKQVEKERDLKCEESTKEFNNVKLEVESRRRELEARQKNVEAVVAEVFCISS